MAKKSKHSTKTKPWKYYKTITNPFYQSPTIIQEKRDKEAQRLYWKDKDLT